MEKSFLLDSLLACTDTPSQFKMYFTVNLKLANYFGKWKDSIMPTIDLDITEGEQTLQLELQDLNQNTLQLID